MKYNESLKSRHESIRKQTINELLATIENIKAFEGEEATISAKKIITNSNLSRSVLYKSHVLKIWNYELWNIRYNKDEFERQILTQKRKQENDHLVEENIKLQTQLEKIKHENDILTKKNEELKIRLRVYRDTHHEEKLELNLQIKRVIGECQRLSNILLINNISF